VILHFAVSIFAPLVRGHAETTNGSALGCVTQLGIAPEISHDNYFIEGHEEPFSSFSGFTDRRDTITNSTRNNVDNGLIFPVSCASLCLFVAAFPRYRVP
jgi:hypothetical protein